MNRDLRDITIVILLSLLGVAIIIWFAAHGGGPSKDDFAKWGGFITTTGIVFGLTMKYHFKSSKRRFSLYLLVFFLLVVHLIVGIWGLSRLTSWSMAWWAPITVLETMALDVILRIAGHGTTESTTDH